MFAHEIVNIFEIYRRCGGSFSSNELPQAIEEAIPIIRESKIYKEELERICSKKEEYEKYLVESIKGVSKKR